MDKKDKRNYNLDIIRIFALICVISVHFFYNNDFYNQIITGKKMYILVLLRSFFMICVPLFIVLTGYLMNNKKLGNAYFKGIKKVLIEYIVCSMIIYTALCFYKNIHFSLYDFIFGILSFKNIKYAWYVEMYIGLYLLIPFLNLIYHNLKNRKDKKTLLLVMIFLTALPEVVNMFYFKNVNILNSSFEKQQLLPQWWTCMYPLTYYFIGCYLSEYKIGISKFKNIVLIMCSTITLSTASFISSYGQAFDGAPYQDHKSLFVLITTVLCFIFIINLRLKLSIKVKKTLKTLSNAVFSAYLFSYLYDVIIYSKFENKYILMPILIIIIFILSILSSLIINLLINTIKNKSFKQKHV